MPTCKRPAWSMTTRSIASDTGKFGDWQLSHLIGHLVVRPCERGLEGGRGRGIGLRLNTESQMSRLQSSQTGTSRGLGPAAGRPYAFLTTELNDVVRPVREKAIQ